VDARDRLAGARGWVRPDGLPFADTVADITAGKIFYPPRLDEFGNDIGSNSVFAFSGTGADGMVNAGETCMDWTVTTGSAEGGQPDATTQIWTEFGTLSCGGQYRLYCFGTDHSQPVLPPANTGRLAFLSSLPFAPSTGLAAADSLCENDATAAALTGTYKALLATENVHAASRFNLTGSTWVRLDGVKVVNQASDLTDPQLMAPLNLQADGATYLGNVNVWKGADDFNTVGVGTSCSSWTSTVGDGNVNRAAKSILTPLLHSNCAVGPGNRVYCLQE
jgi:hypothetical protein